VRTHGSGLGEPGLRPLKDERLKSTTVDAIITITLRPRLPPSTRQCQWRGFSPAARLAGQRPSPSAPTPGPNRWHANALESGHSTTLQGPRIDASRARLLTLQDERLRFQYHQHTTIIITDITMPLRFLAARPAGQGPVSPGPSRHPNEWHAHRFWKRSHSNLQGW
jgi:hypothetical protein